MKDRPYVWTDEYWLDEEEREVAKTIAYLFCEDGAIKRPMFISEDPIAVINSVDDEWGLVYTTFPAIAQEFGCELEIDEFTDCQEMTFGDLVRIVLKRKGDHPFTHVTL